MKKPLLILFALASLLPFPLLAEEATTTEPSTPPQETITVNVNVRYQSTLVYNGPATVVKSSVTSAVDSQGNAHQLPSDSALATLIAADNASADFSISNLSYYADFGSFYLKCMNIAALGKDACENWQYVVNSTYPPTGSDHYKVSNGDTVYFYFGNPRRVSLSTAAAEKDSQVAVKTEAYDYTNDSWTPLSGATVGATQPNPNDPYSPNVVSTATSDQDGIAKISLSNPGSYGIGLAMDFYSWLESLNIFAPEPKAEERVSRSGGNSSARAAAAAAASASPITSTAALAASSTPTVPGTTTPAVIALSPASIPNGDILIASSFTAEEFAARYQKALAAYSATPRYVTISASSDPETNISIPMKTVDTNAENQFAAAAESPVTVSSSTASTTPLKSGKGWFKSILSIFGL